MRFTPERQDHIELLDMGIGTAQDVKDNFAEIGRINRYLGGISALTRYIYPSLISISRLHNPVIVLDIGTGSADIPQMLINWAQKQPIELRILGLELSTRNLILAQSETQGKPEIKLLQGDALTLPFAPSSCDIVISSLFLHHLTPEYVVEVLRSAFHCARHTLIMSDLVRGWLPLAAFRLVQPIFARNYLTRNDGMVSIRRAYTPDELRLLAQKAGLTNATVTTHWPWRMTLVAYK